MENSKLHRGKWIVPDCRHIDLPWSEASLRTVLKWGTDSGTVSFTHQEISQWCCKLVVAWRDRDLSDDMDRIVVIANDVDAQWDLYLANTYSLEELQQLDLSAVKLPSEWFDDWTKQLGKP